MKLYVSKFTSIDKNGLRLSKGTWCCTFREDLDGAKNHADSMQDANMMVEVFEFESTSETPLYTARPIEPELAAYCGMVVTK